MAVVRTLRFSNPRALAERKDFLLPSHAVVGFRVYCTRKLVDFCEHIPELAVFGAHAL